MSTTTTNVTERPIRLRDWEVRAILAGAKTQFRRPVMHCSFRIGDRLRCGRLRLKVTDIRVQSLQDITEADAIAEGLNQQACADVFDKAAGAHKTHHPYYVLDAQGNETGDDYCYDCAMAANKGNGGEVWSAGDYPESDGPAMCSTCGRVLELSLSEYGVERELRIEDDPKGKEPQHFPVKGQDAKILQTIADGIGDLRDEHLGRLAQIGFATLWDSLYGKKPGLAWSDNPRVRAVSFRVLSSPAAPDAAGTGGRNG